jgi:hypothetical protein
MSTINDLYSIEMNSSNKGLKSEWLLFDANSAIFQLYHGENVNFQWDDHEVRFVPDQHEGLDFYSANSLKQQSG